MFQQAASCLGAEVQQLLEEVGLDACHDVKAWLLSFKYVGFLKIAEKVYLCSK